MVTREQYEKTMTEAQEVLEKGMPGIEFVLFSRIPTDDPETRQANISTNCYRQLGGSPEKVLAFAEILLSVLKQSRNLETGRIKTGGQSIAGLPDILKN